jgi:hypothetical protein
MQKREQDIWSKQPPVHGGAAATGGVQRLLHLAIERRQPRHPAHAASQFFQLGQCDRPEERIVRLSDRARDLLGYDPQELADQQFEGERESLWIESLACSDVTPSPQYFIYVPSIIGQQGKVA